MLAFLRAQIAATDYVFADKAGSLAIMRKHVKGVSDADLEATYTEMVTSKGGLNRRGAMNMDGVQMLLTLRNELSGSAVKLTDANKYIDLSYYQKALGGKVMTSDIKRLPAARSASRASRTSRCRRARSTPTSTCSSRRATR